MGSNLGLQAVRGAIWNIANSVGARIIGAIGSLIIARYISPDEYGAVMFAVLIVWSADEITSFGLLQYIVAHPKAEQARIFHVSFFYLFFGLFGLFAAWMLIDFWENFFKCSTIHLYMPGMILAVAFERVGKIADRVLAKDLRFAVTSLTRGIAELVYTGIAVTLAIVGFGGHAIIYGNIAQYAFFMGALVLATHIPEWFTPHRLSWKHTRAVFRFGLPLFMGDIANYASRNWDTLLLGRLFGQKTLGHYNYAYQLANIPAIHVGEHIGDVLLPTFARMDQEERAFQLIRSTAMLALIVFPLAVGLGTIAHTLTYVLFDPRWHPLAPMLAVLSALSVTRPLGWTVTSYQVSRGQTGTVGSLEVGKVVILLSIMLALSPLGPVWTCAAAGIAFGLHALASIFAVKHADNIPVLNLLGGVVPPLLACIPMAAAVLAVRYLLRSLGFSSGVLSLVAEIGVGAIVYIPSALIIAHSVSRDFISLMKEAFNRKKAD
ncbi:MAG: oligosaccharide flippase family protein [Pseudomonadota bacterium]